LSSGIKLSKLNAKLNQIIDLRAFIGKMQQNGLLKIVYDLAQDQEPLVQLTEKGREQAIELLHILQDSE
jgi:hypothetical protein